jgi:hypothetical protein
MFRILRDKCRKIYVDSDSVSFSIGTKEKVVWRIQLFVIGIKHEIGRMERAEYDVLFL